MTIDEIEYALTLAQQITDGPIVVRVRTMDSIKSPSQLKKLVNDRSIRTLCPKQWWVNRVQKITTFTYDQKLSDKIEPNALYFAF